MEYYDVKKRKHIPFQPDLLKQDNLNGKQKIKINAKTEVYICASLTGEKLKDKINELKVKLNII